MIMGKKSTKACLPKQQSLPKQLAEARGVCFHGLATVAGYPWGEVAIVAADPDTLKRAFEALTGGEMDVSRAQDISIFRRSDVKAV
ncbi:MAG: hypothetical protein ACT4NV_03215 [Rhodoferax sp.]